MGTLVSSASVHTVQGISVLFSENAIIHPCFPLVTQVALSVLINYFLNGIFEALSRFREWYDAYLCVQGSSSTVHYLPIRVGGFQMALLDGSLMRACFVFWPYKSVPP